VSTIDEREILEDIKKTGYPLEVHVADVMEENGWLIFPEYPSYDRRTKKIRTLDVLGACFLVMSKKFARLLVECKTNTNTEKPWKKAWVFFQSRRLKEEVAKLQQNKPALLSQISFFGMTVHSLIHPYVKYNAGAQEGLPQNVAQSIFGDFQNIHFFDQSLPMAHSCHVVGKKPSEVGDFQRAILQLRAASIELSPMPGYVPIFGTIVFKGDMYEFNPRNTKNPIDKINHILFYTQYLLEYEAEEDYFSSEDNHVFPPVVVDVVKDTYFAEYLKLLKKDLEILDRLYARLDETKEHE
jgi:hypothetical protein